MSMQVLDAGRDASVGYKWVSRAANGSAAFRRSGFSWPDDERFLSLGELAATV